MKYMLMRKADRQTERGVMPLDKTFWAEGFGMLSDRFGIAWMLNTGVAALEDCRQKIADSA